MIGEGPSSGVVMSLDRPFPPPPPRGRWGLQPGNLPGRVRIGGVTNSGQWWRGVHGEGAIKPKLASGGGNAPGRGRMGTPTREVNPRAFCPAPPRGVSPFLPLKGPSSRRDGKGKWPPGPAAFKMIIPPNRSPPIGAPGERRGTAASHISWSNPGGLLSSPPTPS